MKVEPKFNLCFGTETPRINPRVLADALTLQISASREFPRRIKPTESVVKSTYSELELLSRTTK